MTPRSVRRLSLWKPNAFSWSKTTPPSGGDSWTPHEIKVGGDLMNVQFLDPMFGWVLGNKGFMGASSEWHTYEVAPDGIKIK